MTPEQKKIRQRAIKCARGIQHWEPDALEARAIAESLDALDAAQARATDFERWWGLEKSDREVTQIIAEGSYAELAARLDAADQRAADLADPSRISVGGLTRIERSSLVRFANVMADKLRANADKGDAWANDDAFDLLDRVIEESCELKAELVKLTECKTPETLTERRERIREEAADVANMAMMVADAADADVPSVESQLAKERASEWAAASLAAEQRATVHPDELCARRKLQVIEPEYAAIMALLTDESMSAVEQIEALQKRAAEGAGDTALAVIEGRLDALTDVSCALTTDRAPRHIDAILALVDDLTRQANEERALALARGGR